MHDTLRAHFASFEKAVRGTSIADDRKEFIASSLERLPAMYAQYRDTNSSRFGDEITRIVQVLLMHLEGCPDSRKINEEFRDGLRMLHEDLGVPVLRLKAITPPAKKTRRTSAA